MYDAVGRLLRLFNTASVGPRREAHGKLCTLYSGLFAQPGTARPSGRILLGFRGCAALYSSADRIRVMRRFRAASGPSTHSFTGPDPAGRPRNAMCLTPSTRLPYAGADAHAQHKKRYRIGLPRTPGSSMRSSALSIPSRAHDASSSLAIGIRRAAAILQFETFEMHKCLRRHLKVSHSADGGTLYPMGCSSLVRSRSGTLLSSCASTIRIAIYLLLSERTPLYRR